MPGLDLEYHLGLGRACSELDLPGLQVPNERSKRIEHRLTSTTRTGPSHGPAYAPRLISYGGAAVFTEDKLEASELIGEAT